MSLRFRLIAALLTFIFGGIFLFLTFKYFSKASSVKADIFIDVNKTLGPVPDRWKALAQGGEEKGVRMLGNVLPQVAGLYPRYIRLDHIYDFYDVVQRDSQGNLTFNFDQLDQTVCDIYNTGAKPFFSLGYMPEALSGDATLVSVPKDWNEWALTVEKTVEHYSGTNTVLCGQIKGYWTTDIYYEVWNEPDLESFGKWSLYGGSKDYKTLYYYSVLGAGKAKNVNHYLIGGPVTTAAYKNWFQVFLNYVIEKNLRIDFLSWHHYSKNTNDFVNDMQNLNEWLSPQEYARFRDIPRIISEWGYDSQPNLIADTNVGAAHTIASIRNFIDQKYELAFLFEVKDGLAPSWGILTNDGAKKPRYYALKLLNLLSGNRLKVEGEGTYIQALASVSDENTTLILVNYDQEEKNTESVPVRIANLNNGTYSLNIQYLDGKEIKLDNVVISNGTFVRNILMPANMVIGIVLSKQST